MVMYAARQLFQRLSRIQSSETVNYVQRTLVCDVYSVYTGNHIYGEEKLHIIIPSSVGAPTETGLSESRGISLYSGGGRAAAGFCSICDFVWRKLLFL